MLFFDFIYYLIFKFYSGYNEKGAESTSAGIIGGLQASNVLTCIMLFSLMYQEKTYINKLIVIVLFLIFQIYTYVRYIYKDKHSINVLEQKWLSKTEYYKKQINILFFIYIAVSIISLFGLALYLGSKN